MKLHHVQQQLANHPIADIPAAVHAALDKLAHPVPAGEIAITAGSRGISNIAAITRAAGDWLKSRGAKPFIVPAMGSHNGATAHGQRAMIESLGITEEAMDMPIRASMDVVEIGETFTGPITMDKFCHESDGVLVLNRIKPHTCFVGPIQSGLMKMMTIGMGKINGARTFHQVPCLKKADAIIALGEAIIGTGKIFAGLGIIEDGYDQTAELHALAPEQFASEEPKLLDHYTNDYFPKLPAEEFDVLIVDQIGKTFSGLGMDPNVIGRRGLAGVPDFPSPRIGSIAALELTTASQGNALGFGLGDCITQRLYDAIDFEKTRINAETTGDMDRIRMNHIVKDDVDAFNWCGDRSGTDRWLVVPNTLHLDSMYASEGLVDELKSNPQCTVADEPVEVEFVDGRMKLAF
ncbi:lactate racemase domain-containing protein [Aeoliella mucimassa]|uniref:LarA-like N-terminal domain-containing protein n=1 Tax=Aeoliella mucimassa TaxID=2527972 RepID=A0A518AL00_9BACT|nr:lactate racemase domain-containing protein [Aeoliella mucimassa]QDU55400.1 hypothetical protein Pan181_15890 [Aeoliella mucimassa]